MTVCKSHKHVRVVPTSSTVLTHPHGNETESTLQSKLAQGDHQEHTAPGCQEGFSDGDGVVRTRKPPYSALLSRPVVRVITLLDAARDSWR